VRKGVSTHRLNSGPRTSGFQGHKEGVRKEVSTHRLNSGPRTSGFQGLEEGVRKEVSTHRLNSGPRTSGFHGHEEGVCKEVSINGLSSIVLGSLASRYLRRAHIAYSITQGRQYSLTQLLPRDLWLPDIKRAYTRRLPRTGARNIKRCQYSLAELQNQDRQLPWTGEGKRKEVSIHWLNFGLSSSIIQGTRKAFFFTRSSILSSSSS
jgi:hypothetical protein